MKTKLSLLGIACLTLTMAGFAAGQNSNTNTNTNTGRGNTNTNTNRRGNTNTTTTNTNRNDAGDMNTGNMNRGNNNTNTNAAGNNNNTNMNRGRNDAGRNNTTGGGNTGNNANTMAGMGGNLTAMDAKFLMDAAMGNNAEIMMSQLAVQKAGSPDVKSFAQMMVDHHTRANQELAQMAQQMGMTLPSGVAPNNQILMAGLQNLSGADFDMAYIKQQLGNHAMAVDMYEMADDDAKDRGLKTYAKRNRPIVQQHYEMVRNLDNRMSPAMTTMAPRGNQ